MSDVLISSNGFVNYFSSAERTEREVANVFNKHGKDVVIINGEDDWNASPIFHISTLLKKFKINILDSFHDGISGITKSGCVIAKADLPAFIKKFNKYKWQMWRTNMGQTCMTNRIRIFDLAVGNWQTFFELKFGDTTICSKHEDDGPTYYRCKKPITCTFNNFKALTKDKSVYFSTSNIQWYWKWEK